MINGNYEEIEGNKVINAILANIEEGDHCNNIPSSLKTLVIMDLVIETRLYLSKLKDYTNPQILYIHPSTSS
jgi:hypothetical protein